MSGPKSKLPDFKEVTSMATKLFKDVKTSLTEIIVEYKKKRTEKTKAQPPANTEKVVVKKEKVETITEKTTSPKKPRAQAEKKKGETE